VLGQDSEPAKPQRAVAAYHTPPKQHAQRPDEKASFPKTPSFPEIVPAKTSVVAGSVSVLPAGRMPKHFPSLSQFPSLPLFDADFLSKKRARVCIVTDDLVGPTRNGGIGTAQTALSLGLHRAGHEVTILFSAGQYSERHSFDHWVRDYAQKGIRLVPLPPPTLPYKDGDHLFRSYEVYAWLKKHAFDVIHFHEWHGRGYYSCLAKRLGLAFQGTTVCVTTHSPLLWHKLQNHETLDALWEIEMDFLERKSIELADVVLSPSQYMLHFLQSQGVSLPENTFVAQNLVPPLPTLPTPTKKPDFAPQPVREYVFFGRLEPRKGLLLFCDALDRLDAATMPGLRVTFLGKEGTVSGQASTDFLKERSARWPFRTTVLPEKSHTEALAYLAAPFEEGRVAVMASLADNSPYTVLECLHARIPFVASRVGGIPELVAEEDADTVLFDLSVESLAAKLNHVWKRGLASAKPSEDATRNEQRVVAWHAELAQDTQDTVSQPLSCDVAVFVFADARTEAGREKLRAQLASFAHLSPQPAESFWALVGLSQEAAETLFSTHLPTQAPNRSGQVRFRTEPTWTEAEGLLWAKTEARSEAFVRLFGMWARPDAISVLGRAAAQSSAECFTFVTDEIDGWTVAQNTSVVARHLPLGDCAAAGFFRDCAGGPDWMVKTAVLKAGSGFFSDESCDHRAFLSRLFLSGYSLRVVPEVLTNIPSDHRPVSFDAEQATLEAYRHATRPDLWPALLLSRSLFLQQQHASLPPNVSQVLSDLLRVEQALRKHPRLYIAARQLFQQGLRLSKWVVSSSKNKTEAQLGH
jgi:glycosyltransferase involved in cell wall biosynthesis